MQLSKEANMFIYIAESVRGSKHRRPSIFASATPVTSTERNSNVGGNKASAASTRNSRSVRLKSAQCAAPVTPTKSYFPERHRDLIFGPATTKPLNARSSLPKTPDGNNSSKSQNKIDSGGHSLYTTLDKSTTRSVGKSKAGGNGPYVSPIESPRVLTNRNKSEGNGFANSLNSSPSRSESGITGHRPYNNPIIRSGEKRKTNDNNIYTIPNKSITRSSEKGKLGDDDLRNNLEKTPTRGVFRSHLYVNSRIKDPPIGTEQNKINHELRGCKPVPTLTKKKNPEVQGKRDISDKIEQLYRAKSMERKFGEPSQTVQQLGKTFVHTANSKRTNQISSFSARRSSKKDPIGRKQSKVADMKKLFDVGFDSKPSPTNIPIPNLYQAPTISNFPSFAKDEVSVCSLVKPPTPPPLPLQKAMRSSTVSPKTVKRTALDSNDSKSLDNDSLALQTTTSNQAFFEANEVLPAPKISPRKSTVILDKVKHFETLRLGKEKMPCQNQEPRLIRKVRRSLRSIFEPPMWKSKEGSDTPKQAIINVKDVQEVVDEFQDKNRDTVTKRTLNSYKWQPIVPHSKVTSTDGAMSIGCVNSPEQEEVEVLIIKEVECGLKHPKPLRVVEMKRMMMICRERVGAFGDKEKRILYSKKV